MGIVSTRDKEGTRLIYLSNVIITLYQAFLTKETLNNIAETTVSNILFCCQSGGICDDELC